MTYLGPPDHIHVEQGTSYTSNEMRRYFNAAGVEVREAPIEPPGEIGVV